MYSNIFLDRLGEIYEFSILKCELGKGTLISDNDIFKVDWALNMDVKGEITFVVSLNDNMRYETGGRFIQYSFDGCTKDNIWSVKSNGVIFNQMTFNTETEGFTYVGTAQIVEFKRKTYDINNSNRLRLKAIINNFDFSGLEFTKNETQCIRNKFTTMVQDKDIEFRLMDNSELLIKLIKCNRIESAAMSYLSFDMDQDYFTDELETFMSNISWFISLITLNTTFISYLEINNDSDIIYKRLLGSTLNYKYLNNGLIDNFYIKSGIKSIFESSFEEFVSLKNSLEITKTINTLLKIERESIIEFKLAFLLLAYEQLATKFLLLNNKDEKTVKDYNIQQKIQQVNSLLRFIPSSHQGDDLRDNVRNDIFHLGDIPLLSFNEKIEIFNKYYELLYKILFRILKYNGKYFSRIKHQPIDV